MSPRWRPRGTSTPPPSLPRLATGSSSLTRPPSRQVRSAAGAPSRRTWASQPGRSADAASRAMPASSVRSFVATKALDAVWRVAIRSPRRRSSLSLTDVYTPATTTTANDSSRGPATASAAPWSTPSATWSASTTSPLRTIALTPVRTDTASVAARQKMGRSQRAELVTPPDSWASSRTNRASTTRAASTAVRSVRGHRLGSQRRTAWTASAARQPATARARSRAVRSSHGVRVAAAMIPSASTRPAVIAAWRSSSEYQSRRARAPSSEVQRDGVVPGIPPRQAVSGPTLAAPKRNFARG